MGIFRQLRASFFTGLIVITPVMVTFWLVVTFITFVDARVKPLIPKIYNPESYLPFAIPGLGLVFAVIFITMLGAFAANVIGRFFLGTVERWVSRVPYVRSVYSALKQLVDTVAAQRNNSFKEVALLEYPRRGLWAIGFVSAGAQGEVAKRLGPDHVGVFVPSTPNPTSGFILFVARSDLTILDMSVEDGAKLIVSGGLVSPGLAGADSEASAGSDAPSKPTSLPATD